MDRKMDGVFFRVNRSGEWRDVCFSDLTEEQMDLVMEDRSIDWLKDLCKILAKELHDIGDYFDIVSEVEE